MKNVGALGEGHCCSPLLPLPSSAIAQSHSHSTVCGAGIDCAADNIGGDWPDLQEEGHWAGKGRK
jgi:hypothetical protein